MRRVSRPAGRCCSNAITTNGCYGAFAPLTRIDWMPPLENFLPVTSA
jgi:hypothetical protein